MEESEEEEEEDDRMEVEEEEEEQPARAPVAGKKRGARGNGASSLKRARRRQAAEEEEEEEEQEEGEGPDDDGYVDPRFHKPAAATAAAATAPARPAAATTATTGGRLSWGDPGSYLPSFWRASGGGGGHGGGGRYSSPGSPSKRVAFREKLEDFEKEESDNPPPSRRGPSTSPLRRRRSSAASSLPPPPQPQAMPSPPRSILKKPRRPSHPLQEGEGEKETGREEDGRATRISFLGTLQPAAASLRQATAKAGVLLLGLLVAGVWLLLLAGALWLLHTLLWREGCPAGQVRDGSLGLWGDCVVSTRTVRQLLRALEHATVQQVCADLPWAWRPWANSKYAEPGALDEGSPLLPVFSVVDLWAQPLGVVDYPWRDLEELGVQRAWGASTSHVRVHLKGRPEVLRALWREWALPCRGKLLLAEHWRWAAAGLLLLLGGLWALATARARRRARREAERVKRVVLDLLASEGEIAPEHARDELLQHLPREYRHLGLTRAALKRLWPRVVRLVERDSRVTKAPRERHGRAIAHWVWMGRRSSVGAGAGAGGGGGGLRHLQQPLNPIHEEGEAGGRGGDGGARAVVI